MCRKKEKKENIEENVDENIPKANGYISELEFNDGSKVELKKDDIVVFVGANNAGKSQSLKDIYNLCSRKIETKVVKNIKVKKLSNNIREYMKSISKVTNDGNFDTYKTFEFQEKDILAKFDEFNNPDTSFGIFRNVFVANLETQNRLSIITPPQIISRNEVYQHPIHFAAYDSEKKEWLSKNFKKAFGKEIIPNKQDGMHIPLCIGDKVSVEEIDEQDMDRILNEYSKILNKYDKVHEQGDGIKSFTGILLYLMIERSIYLIDEPESFLHPPQANIMGKIIAENLTDNQQMFISTHSEELLKGLLENATDRVKIIRIERNGETNTISVLNNQNIKDVWNDPILKYSNIMSGLFHNEVVICESDSDCKMYSIINNYLNEQKGKYSETLFIHAGGKNRIFRIVEALKSLNVKIKVIVDIDILNDENVFKTLIESFDIDWKNQIERKYKCIESSLYQEKNEIKIDELIKVIEPIKNSGKKILTETEIKILLQVLKKTSKWENIKNFGINGIPKGDATKAYSEINDLLETKGIFIVPVGELECFVRDVGGHGPEWVEKVIETHIDFGDEVYNEIKSFVSKLNL